jgi:sodium transport system permease protein
MGPVVVGLVSVATRDNAKPDAASAVLVGMMAIFTLVSAFVGGMNVAMDTVAGERERRSLLPLLLNPISRRSVLLGKWLAVSFFALAGLALDVLGFAAVLFASGIHVAIDWPRVLIPVSFGLFSLPFLAAALQLLISTVCRAIKEAQTYLSLIVFAPMGLGMFLVFDPEAKRAWCSVLPLVGQQMQLEALLGGHEVGFLQPLALGLLTVALSVLVLLVAANRLQQDEIIYGN